ncbi:MAG: hypothetical protein ACFFDN_41930 [Candidatus Hodarchaeota archaeon]
MSTLDFILVLFSFISFGLAIFSFINTEIKKVKERANFELISQKLKALHEGLEALFHSADAIVQVAKGSDAKVTELQNMARVLRGHVYLLAKNIKNSREGLKKWRFGKMIESEPIVMIQQKKGKNNHEEVQLDNRK